MIWKHLFQITKPLMAFSREMHPSSIPSTWFPQKRWQPNYRNLIDFLHCFTSLMPFSLRNYWSWAVFGHPLSTWLRYFTPIISFCLDSISPPHLSTWLATLCCPSWVTLLLWYCSSLTSTISCPSATLPILFIPLYCFLCFSSLLEWECFSHFFTSPSGRLIAQRQYATFHLWAILSHPNKFLKNSHNTVTIHSTTANQKAIQPI